MPWKATLSVGLLKAGLLKLRPRWLPISITMLEHLLDKLNADHVSKHDCLMLKDAIKLRFFGYLRSSEFINLRRI